MTEDLNVVANSNLEIQLLDGDLNIIQKLDDEPNDVGGLTSAELKAKFDESGNIIKKYINETLIPAVLAEDATEEARKQAEAARVTAEQGRVTAEKGRVSAETARAQAEDSRTSAETARGNAESQRASAETTRVDNETARNQGETTRVAAENARANAETARGQAEQNRSQSETARDQAETARRNSENIRATSEAGRAQAEQNRASAENNRASAEASRSRNETAREGAESTRQTNETARQNAESARQTAETKRAQAETARNVWEDYDSAKTYQPGNKVYWQGSSYVCLKACTGISPENGTYWQLVVRSGFASDSAFGFDVVNGRLLCYYSGENPPPFRLGDDGHLYVDLDKTYDLGKVTGGSGGGVDIDLGMTGAAVGQIAKISAVDANGKPTAWEPVDMAGGETWEKLVDTSLAEPVESVTYTFDNCKRIKALIAPVIASDEYVSGWKRFTINNVSYPSLNNTMHSYEGICLRIDSGYPPYAQANVNVNTKLSVNGLVGGAYTASLENIAPNGITEFGCQTAGILKAGTKIEIWGVKS